MKLTLVLLATIFTVLLFICGLLPMPQQGLAAQSFFDPHGNYNASTEGCADCHDTHASSGSRLLTAADQKNLCYACHDGSNSNYNVKMEFGEVSVGSSVYNSAHPVPNGIQICTNCHNPHLTNSTTPQLLEVGTAKVSTGNEVCGQCHGPGSEVVGGNVYSPFVGTPHDVKMTNPASGTQIKCVRCHQPHGSSVKPLLQNAIVSQTGGVNAVTGDDNTVCFACHQDVLGSYSGSTVFQTTYHGTKTTSTIADVYYPGTSYSPTLCLNCHEPHGKTGITYYRRADGNDLCFKCHDAPSVARPAGYSYQGSGAYANSQHSLIPASGPRVPTGYCGNCHTPHGQDDGTGKAVIKQLTMTLDKLCFGGGSGCHSDAKNSRMGINIKQRVTASTNPLAHHSIDPTEQQANGTKVQCTNCHDPHLDTLVNSAIDPYNRATPYPFSNTVPNYIGPGGEIYLMISSKHDGVAPVIISGPTVSAMTATGCTITWTTDQATNGTVLYGPTTAYGSSVTSIDSPTTFVHTAHVTGLVQGQNYHYIVKSYDPVGNNVFSSDALLDPNPPVVTVGPLVSTSGGNTTITWNTDEISTSSVVYGVSSYVYSAGNPALNTSHSVTIGLPPGDVYHYKISSSDIRGNTYTSGEYTIDTTALPPSDPVLVTQPDHNDGVDAINVTLNWIASTDPFSNPISYVVQISQDSTFSTVWQTSAWQSGTSWSVVINNQDTVNWYWRVQAQNSQGAASAWSTSSFYHTGSSSGGSCPNLFAWAGKKFKFITDIIGPGSIGIPVGKGKYLRANPKEYIRLDQSQLVPQDGRYKLRIKEELTDLDYFDQVKLLAVDHPIGTEVFPSDRKMTIGIPPSFHLFTTRKQRTPKSAVDRNGKDVLPLISKLDRKYTQAHPFYDDLLTMDLGDLSGAKTIKFILNGWIRYPDSKVMKKVKGGLDFSPPYLEVMGTNGKWVRLNKDMGYPAGLNKTIVLDLTGKFPKKGDYRVRLHTAPQIYWDYIAVDTSRDAAVKVKQLNPVVADLHYKGFSKKYWPDMEGPQIYDYNTLQSKAPAGFPVPEGKFTRYGNVLPLLEKADDEYVIMGAGDEISLEFPAMGLPAKGMTRTYLFYSDGFFKEQNKSFAGNQVEPLPFHGMSNYPYQAGENYPNDASHRQYLKVWNTRVYHTASKPETGFFARIKEFFDSLVKALTRSWDSIFGSSRTEPAPKMLVYRQKSPPWLHAPSYEKHYSLNTNYVTLQLDNFVTTAVYNANSPGVILWENNTLPTPASPGTDVTAANIPNVATSDNLRWRTDSYPNPNTNDGQYNYQMVKFVIGGSPDKLYSIKVGWQGYGEPSPGYPTTMNVWNFVYSRWDQVYSNVISSDTGVSIEENMNLQPFCYKCHAGTTPTGVQVGSITKNISSTYPTDIHGGGSGPQYVAANGGGDWSPTSFGSAGKIGGAYSRSNAPLPCNDCHDTHGSSSIYHLREHLNGDINKDPVNYPNGNNVPVADSVYNANVLHFCQSCHVGTLYQYHQPCLDCHRTNTVGHYDWATGPTPEQDDFGRACLSCHYHGATYPSHGQCHCSLDAPVKAF